MKDRKKDLISMRFHNVRYTNEMDQKFLSNFKQNFFS